MAVPFSLLPTLPHCLLFMFQAWPTCPLWKKLPPCHKHSLPLSSSTPSLSSPPLCFGVWNWIFHCWVCVWFVILQCYMCLIPWCQWILGYCSFCSVGDDGDVFQSVVLLEVRWFVRLEVAFFFLISKFETFWAWKLVCKSFWKMGFGNNNAIKAGSLDVGKSKGRKKVDGVQKKRGWWPKFSFFGSCIPSRSKVVTSISGTSTHNGKFSFPYPSSLVSGNISYLTSILGAKVKIYLSLLFCSMILPNLFMFEATNLFWETIWIMSFLEQEWHELLFCWARWRPN